MQEWDGGNQDITSVLRALADYRDAGLQAAIFFRRLEDVQKIIVNYPNGDRETLLMFMFYDETSNHNYSRGTSNRSDSAKYMLDICLRIFLRLRIQGFLRKVLLTMDGLNIYLFIMQAN